MKLGLSLSGGGIKGAVHIGVLKAFEEENIKIDYISGASSGSVVATLHAAGYNADEIYDIFKNYSKNVGKINFKNIFKLVFGLIFKRKIIIDGLNDGKDISEIINIMCEKKGIHNISDFKMPLLIPAVSLCTGRLYIFSSKENTYRAFDPETEYLYNANIGTVVQSSCSFPGIFSPCTYENIKLIDGGIRENVPWHELKNTGADFVVSVVFEEPLNDKCNSVINVVSNSIDILSRELAIYELEGADYLLKINTPAISLLDNKKIDYLYDKGYYETKLKIKEIKEIISKFP